MKTSHLAARAAAVLAMCMLLTSRASAQTEPSVPVGTLTAYPTIVRTGTFPTLTWNITYPSTIANFISVQQTDGTLTTLVQPQTMTVQVLGASVIEVWLDCYGNVIQSQYLPVQASFSYNHGPWVQMWQGTQQQVNPSTVVYTKTITAVNASLDFGGCYLLNGSYSTFFNSINNTNNNRNILALTNGQYPPTNCCLYGQPTIASFLQNYMNATTKQVTLGPKQIIYLFELTDTDPSSPGFDFNDLCILVTFN